MLEFEEILAVFEPITLAEMDGVVLMDRIDTKYAFNVQKFPLILSYLKDEYRILEIDNVRSFKYKSVYFDTPDRKMFHDHRVGRPIRFKIRRREYLDSGLNFMEIKMKNASGRTRKERIKKGRHEEHLSSDTIDFLEMRCPFKFSQLESALVNTFSRLTFVHKKNAERLTIDMCLTFHSHNGAKHEIPYLVIAELKSDSNPINSFFANLMRTMNIRKYGLSKYCIGTIMVDPDINHNAFMPSLKTIKKIENDIC